MLRGRGRLGTHRKACSNWLAERLELVCNVCMIDEFDDGRNAVICSAKLGHSSWIWATMHTGYARSQVGNHDMYHVHLGVMERAESWDIPSC